MSYSREKLRVRFVLHFPTLRRSKPPIGPPHLYSCSLIGRLSLGVACRGGLRLDTPPIGRTDHLSRGQTANERATIVIAWTNKRLGAP